MPLRTPVVLWLTGTALSLLGTQAMGFALVWSAAAHGAPLAALTLSAIVVPRVALLLPGGALADRLGAWRVLIAADLGAALAMLACALLLAGLPGASWPIPLAALASGLTDAVYLPASATVPRLLTPESAAGAAGLSRAMAARQIAGQSAALTGPALGGLAVTVAGLAPVVTANAATFAVMALVLARLRPHLPHLGRPGPRPGAVERRRAGGWARAVAAHVRHAGDGLRVVLADPVLRAALALAGVAAAFLLPVAGLLLPLLARDRGWPGTHTGLIAAALAAGTGAVALAVLLRGALPRPGVAAPAGLLVAACGVAGLALGHGPLPAAAAALVTGAGSGVFATHLGPLFLARSPRTHLARTQSVLVLAQSLPLLATQNALGAAAGPAGVPVLLMICAAALALASGAALGAGRLRAS